MRERDSNRDLRRAHIETALQVAERHRQRTEQQLMPTMTLHLSEMQQFMEGARLVARDINETLEQYRQLGHEMAQAIRKFQRDAEEAIKIARVVLQPTLDAISREIARRNAITVEPVSSKNTEIQTTTVTTVERPKNWLPCLPEGSMILCPCIALHIQRKAILFQTREGWFWENIQPLQRKVLEILWRAAQKADTMGFTVKELGQKCPNKKRVARSSISICNRINELNDLSGKYGHMNLIITDGRKRKFNPLLWKLQ